jgi:acetyl esterase/lipase
VALKARDHFAKELDGQVLLSPLVDAFMGSASMREADAIGMRARWAEGWSQYLSAGVCHPYAAPCLCSRMAGVAPTLLLTANDDPLRDEATGYAERLAQAGNKVRQHVLPAGTGWPSIYGGKTDDAATWQDSVRKEFAGFIADIGQH